jgi:hypothetical protein
MANGVTKVVFKWYHYAGGFGAILTIIGLIWGFYAHFDMKAHDRNMAEKAIEAQEAGKSDVQINLDLPDVNVDGTVESIKGTAGAAKVKAAEATANIKETTGKKWDSVKEYWRGKREAERDPFEPPTELTKPQPEEVTK